MAGIPACATDPKRPRCHDGTPETNGRISMSYSRSPLGPWSTKVALAIGGVPDSQWNCKHNNPSALVESDGRILLMYMRNRQFLSTVYIQMISLPRHAWDKHRKALKKANVFLRGDAMRYFDSEQSIFSLFSRFLPNIHDGICFDC
jgi:hypothetical protein